MYHVFKTKHSTFSGDQLVKGKINAFINKRLDLKV